MSIVINPCTGRVANATLAEAEKNMRWLIQDVYGDDVELPVVYVKRIARNDDDEGRFGFALKVGKRECEVEMPGVPLDRVRFVDEAKQNIWHFPRLYVDGSSWVWKFAVDIVRDQLFGDEE